MSLSYLSWSYIVVPSPISLFPTICQNWSLAQKLLWQPNCYPRTSILLIDGASLKCLTTDSDSLSACLFCLGGVVQTSLLSNIKHLLRLCGQDDECASPFPLSSPPLSPSIFSTMSDSCMVQQYAPEPFGPLAVNIAKGKSPCEWQSALTELPGRLLAERVTGSARRGNHNLYYVCKQMFGWWDQVISFKSFFLATERSCSENVHLSSPYNSVSSCCQHN